MVVHRLTRADLRLLRLYHGPRPPRWDKAVVVLVAYVDRCALLTLFLGLQQVSSSLESRHTEFGPLGRLDYCTVSPRPLDEYGRSQPSYPRSAL